MVAAVQGEVANHYTNDASGIPHMDQLISFLATNKCLQHFDTKSARGNALTCFGYGPNYFIIVEKPQLSAIQNKL